MSKIPTRITTTLKRYRHRALIAVGFGMLLTGGLSQASGFNGFDLRDSSIAKEQIYSGGPPRDGIPSIDNPRFIRPAADRLLEPDSRVVGVELDGVSRAYPIAILNWHELVNDRIGSRPVVISYCPLCGTALVFDAQIANDTAEEQRLQFGVSGLLYNSDLLLYDRNTESLWSQITGEAITGPLKGQRLSLLPAQLTSWQRWLAQHPDTLVLSSDTGYQRDYRRSPYGDYDLSDVLYFPVEFLSRRYHPKERVLGVEVDGVYKAYPFAELAKRGDQQSLQDRLANQSLRIDYDLTSRSGRIFDDKGNELPVVNSFWFAWYSFHPQSEVFSYQP